MARRRPSGQGMALLALLAAGVGHAETYAVSATNALAVDREGRLVQRFTVACVADDPAADAAITLSGKDLRFFVADEEPLEVGVDGATWPPGEVTGSYEYDVVAGARVMARLGARCGTEAVFDTVTVDSAPVTLPPVVTGPERIVVADTFDETGPDAVPVGRAVELVGLRVEASPRGTEVVAVSIRGAGVDATLTLGPADFVDGAALIAPRIEPALPGVIEVQAELLGVSSTPLQLTAVDDGLPPDGDAPLDDRSDAVGGCTASGALPPLLPQLMFFVGLMWRRRRAPRS